jgi:hypothetical protein
MKTLAGIIGGLIIAILGAFVVTLAVSPSGSAGSGYGAGAFFAFWLLGVVIALMAPSAPKAWRRLLITAAVLSLLLPLSAIFVTGSHVVGAVDKGGAAATGAAIGGALVSGFMGFLGFFLAAVFLVVGLLVGRDKQIVYVQAPHTPKSET